jgi:hypothetical protein
MTSFRLSLSLSLPLSLSLSLSLHVCREVVIAVVVERREEGLLLSARTISCLLPAERGSPLLSKEVREDSYSVEKGDFLSSVSFGRRNRRGDEFLFDRPLIRDLLSSPCREKTKCLLSSLERKGDGLLPSPLSKGEEMVYAPLLSRTERRL